MTQQNMQISFDFSRVTRLFPDVADVAVEPFL